MERNVNWNKLILAFLIAAFLFTLGLLLGYVVKGVVQGAAISIEENTRNEIANLETAFLLAEDYPCESITSDIVSEKLDYLDKLISALEEKKGKGDKEVLELKKLYVILEVRHILLLEQMKKSCNENYNIFIFFYSNDEGSCTFDVDKTSFILSYLRNKHDSVRVYSIDVDLESDIVSILKNRYGIDSCRTVVLNDNVLDVDLESSEELEKFIVNL